MSGANGKTSIANCGPNTMNKKTQMGVSPMGRNGYPGAFIPPTKQQGTTSKMMGQSCGNMGYAPCFISYLLYKIGWCVPSIPAIKANNEIVDTF